MALYKVNKQTNKQVKPIKTIYSITIKSKKLSNALIFKENMETDTISHLSEQIDKTVFTNTSNDGLYKAFRSPLKHCLLSLCQQRSDSCTERLDHPLGTAPPPPKPIQCTSPTMFTVNIFYVPETHIMYFTRCC